MTATLARPGTTLRYQVSGPADGPLVVLSHGASMDRHLFDPQVEALAAAGYRTLAWDLRGHGESKPIGAAPLTVPGMAADLLALLDHIGATGPVCLVGQSLGGYVAQEVDYRHPERVAALVIIGSTCLTLPIAAWERIALRSSPWWFRAWPYEHLRRVISRATAVTPAGRDYAYRATGQLTKREFVAVWEAVATCLRPDPDYASTRPLLLTHGDADRTGNVAKTAPAWASRAPRARYEVIPGAGHNANHDSPETFNRLMLEFLSEHYPT